MTLRREGRHRRNKGAGGAIIDVAEDVVGGLESDTKRPTAANAKRIAPRQLHESPRDRFHVAVVAQQKCSPIGSANMSTPGPGATPLGAPGPCSGWNPRSVLLHSVSCPERSSGLGVVLKSFRTFRLETAYAGVISDLRR